MIWEDEMEWISVDDRLPEENQTVLVWAGGLGCSQIDFHSGKFYCEYFPENYEENITHWMPLPTPPE